MDDEGIPLCEECGCAGNASCGYDPLNKEILCALVEGQDGPDLICACCDILPKVTRDRIALEEAGQLKLF